MSDFQKMFDRLNADFDSVIRDDLECRRPGIEALFEKVRAEHPTWSDLRVADEAKQRYVRAARDRVARERVA